MKITAFAAIGLVVWILAAGSGDGPIGAAMAASTAVADTYHVNEDTILEIAEPGILGNDVPDGATPIEVTANTTPTSVPAIDDIADRLWIARNGTFTYWPVPDFYGTVEFRYRITGSADYATVTIVVDPVNDVPVAENDAYTINEDTILNSENVLANDADVDGDSLTAVLVSGPSHGTLTLNADGTFSYTPDANYNGPDSFTYRANDGTANSAVATASLTITAVNDAPTAVADAYSLSEDATLTVAAPGVLANDADGEGDAMTAVLVTGPAHGTLTLNADGSLTYTPNANFYGTDTFTYRASDGTANSNTATVTMTVAPVSDAPVAVPDNYETAEDTALTVIAAQGLLANDYDVDGDTLVVSPKALPTHGTLHMNEDGSFTYTPVANYHGSDSFTYQMSAGGAHTEPTTVMITVTSVNDVPTAGNDAYSTSEDTSLTVAAPGVLANDADTEGSSLTAVLVTGPAHGVLTLNADGSFTYDPDPDYNGADAFTYRANDGTDSSAPATVTLTISPVNDAPVTTADAYRVNRNAVLSPVQGVLGNDADRDGDVLTALLVSGPAHGTLTLNADGTFTYTPTSGYVGADSFTYRANDGTVNSAPATVTLTVNTVPVASDDSYSLSEDMALTIPAAGILGNDNDPDGGTLTAELVTGPGYGTLSLNSNGAFVYTPWANYNGWDSFTYRAFDGIEYSATKTVAITVNSVNDVPVGHDDSYDVNEDTVLNIAASGALGNDWDSDGNALGAYIVSGVGHGTLTLFNNGSFRYVPAANFAGDDSFKYTAGDGSANSSAVTVTIHVREVNDLPSVKNPAYLSHVETGKNVGFSIAFSDADSWNTHSAVIYWGDGGRTYGGMSENSGSGTVSGEHTYSTPGKYRITLLLTDNAGESIMYQSDEINVTTPTTSGDGNNNGDSGTVTVTPTASPTVQPSRTPTATPSGSPTPGAAGSTVTFPLWLLGAFFAGIVVIGAGYLIFFRKR